MKKIIAITAAALAIGCTAAMAETNEVYPQNELVLEYTDPAISCTISVEFDPAEINEEKQIINFDVYAEDVYTREEIEALQPGDRIWANDECYTVETIEKTDGGYEINGGFSEDNDGITLVWADGNPDGLWSQLYDGMINSSMRGHAAYSLADEVTLSIFQWDDDDDFSGDYEVVTLPAAEVKPYLMKLAHPENPEDPDTYAYHFTPECTRLTVQNNAVTEIRVDWTPAA